MHPVIKLWNIITRQTKLKLLQTLSINQPTVLAVEYCSTSMPRKLKKYRKRENKMPPWQKLSLTVLVPADSRDACAAVQDQVKVEGAVLGK